MHEPTITFSGNLAAKPQLRAVDTPQGPAAVANLRVAVTPRRRARDGDEWTDGETMWFSVSVWRTTAANSVVSLNQGDRVLVRGRLTQRTWTDADGVERPSLSVEADDVALDISRYPAMSLRRAPAQRPEAAGEAGQWVSTGEIDDETGAVRLTRAGDGEPDGEGEPAEEPLPV